MKKPLGRPTDYRPEYCQMLIEHMAQGLSFRSFAGTLQVTFKTLYNWAVDHEDFLHAKEIGTEQCLVFWEKLGVDNMIGNKETGMINTGMYVFNMKNRFGWADRNETQHTFKPNLKENEGKTAQQLLQETEALMIEVKKESAE